EANKKLLKRANRIAMYSIVCHDELNDIIIQPVLALEIGEQLIFIADEYLWLFGLRDKHILNELAFQIANICYAKGYISISANWGNFQECSMFGEKSLRDLLQPNVKYFANLHYKLKTTDSFPNITFTNNEIKPDNENFI